MPCSPSLKEQVPSAKPSDLSMTIPYVFLSYDLDSHLMFLIKKNNLFNITTKGNSNHTQVDLDSQECLSRTQELLTKIRTICVEIRDIKRTSQKQYIKTPFKGQDKDNPRRTDRSYNNPPHKEEEQDDRPDYSHTASTSLSLSSPPTDNSDIQKCCAGEEASSPATYPSTLPSPSLPRATPPDSLSPFEDASALAGGDQKGCMTGPCSAGIQMDAVLEGRIEGHKSSSCELPPETQVWKEGEGVDGDRLESESPEDLEGEPSPCPSSPSKDKTKETGKRGWKNLSAATMS